MQLASLMDFVAGGLKPALFETMSFQLAFSAWSWSLCRVVRALGCIWPWDAYGNDTSAWILKSLVYNSYGAIHPTCIYHSFRAIGVRSHDVGQLACANHLSQ